MPYRSFQLQESDKANIPQAFAVILASVSVTLIWSSCKEKVCFEFFWRYWSMIWLPVALGYLATSVLQKTNQRITTLQRLIASVTAGIFSIIYVSFILDSESAGELVLFYIFLFIPVQIVLILCVDILLYFLKKHKSSKL